MAKHKAKRKPSEGKVGPPPLDVDPQLIYELSKINCTMIEIAAVLGCSVDYLEQNQIDIIKKGREEGKSSIRREQFRLAQSGNATMLVWLGKNLLGQRDNIVHAEDLTLLDVPTDDLISEAESAIRRIKFKAGLK